MQCNVICKVMWCDVTYVWHGMAWNGREGDGMAWLGMGWRGMHVIIYNISVCLCAYIYNLYLNIYTHTIHLFNCQDKWEMISQFLSTILQNRAFENKICLSWIQHFYPIVPLTYYSKCSKKRQRFAPGQSEAEVRVPILKDSAWHTCEDCPLACQSLGVSIRGPSMPHRHIKLIEYHSITWHAIICLYVCAYTRMLCIFTSLRILNLLWA